MPHMCLGILLERIGYTGHFAPAQNSASRPNRRLEYSPRHACKWLRSVLACGPSDRDVPEPEAGHVQEVANRGRIPAIEMTVNVLFGWPQGTQMPLHRYGQNQPPARSKK